MTLILNSHDTIAASDMGRVMDAIEAATQDEAKGTLVQAERLNLSNETVTMRLMPAIIPSIGAQGFKVFGHAANGLWRYLIGISDTVDGRLLCLMDGNYLTALRTGAATGVATRHLARPDVATVGIIGSGLEARTNLRAVMIARPEIRKATVFSPNHDRREAYGREMSAELGIEITAVAAGSEAVAGADVVIVATNTMKAVGSQIAYKGGWIEPSQHVNAIGATGVHMREADAEMFRRADLLVSDASWDQLERECGDVIAAVACGALDRGRTTLLKDIVSGAHPGRQSADDVTVYKSVGAGLQDVAAGFAAYEHAMELGIGTEVPDFLEPKELR